MSVSRKLLPLLALAVTLPASPARAQDDESASTGFRLHATGALSRALAGHQKDELGWGLTGMGAAEWAVVPELGFQVELGGLWLSEGDAPSERGIAAQGAASSLHAGVGIRIRPAPGDGPVGGPWISLVAGGAQTGGLTRPMFDAGAGWDFPVSPSVGVGPMVGYLHVVQPDDELRPADARIALLGIHASYGPASEQGPGDRDGDRILDPDDRCPDDPEDRDGFQDADGCPDRDDDRDGILDADDACPRVAEDLDGFEDSDGCPEDDNDKDGIPDAKDRCPNDPEDKDGFEDEDGCPDRDNDDDGLVDAVDRCPNEPETPNGYADDDGCPDEEQVRVVGDRIVLDDRIHFATNSARIRPVSHPLLERLAKVIRDNPTYVKIAIHGHADERGPDWFNLRLSKDRAKAVLDFLVRQGIAEERLISDGFGATRPLVDRSDERAWFINRRVDFEITREIREPVRAAKRGSP